MNAIARRYLIALGIVAAAGAFATLAGCCFDGHYHHGHHGHCH